MSSFLFLKYCPILPGIGLPLSHYLFICSKGPAQMVSHGPVDTQLTQYRVFRLGFHSGRKNPHPPAMGNPDHHFQPEPVLGVAIHTVNKTVINADAPEQIGRASCRERALIPEERTSGK